MLPNKSARLTLKAPNYARTHVVTSISSVPATPIGAKPTQVAIRPNNQTYQTQHKHHRQANERIDLYMRNHMVDAHLTLVQTSRVCLLGFGIVAFASSIGAGDPRQRLQCALTSSACFISSLYYTRLYALRRLPVSMGYSLESNTVAESMRYINWTIVIALLGVCAFLLRGPFEQDTYGPFSWWKWDYQTWRICGPIMSSVGTLVGLPGWHASRRARALQLRGKYLDAMGWIGACSVFLGISTFSSLVVGSAMLSPLSTAVPAPRSAQEIALGRSISALWVVYPIVSFVRTAAIVVGAGDWGSEVVGAQRSTTAAERTRKAMLQNAGYYIAGGMFSLARSAYLAIVAAPECKSTVAVTRLTALADGILRPNDLEKANSDTIPLLPNSDFATQDFYESDDMVQTRMRMHVPEVTPLCSQGVDSTLAIVDIFSQAFSALGCAAITLTS